MSIQAVAWALEHSESRGITRLVLIALANHANGDTGECWPSQRTVAREAGIATGTVPNAVKALVDLGEVEVLEAGGPRRSARYRLTFQRSGDEHDGAQDVSAASRPGLSAALTPGVSRTISNRHEPSRGQLHDEMAPCPDGLCDGSGWIDVPGKNAARECPHRRAA